MYAGKNLYFTTAYLYKFVYCVLLSYIIVHKLIHCYFFYLPDLVKETVKNNKTWRVEKKWDCGKDRTIRKVFGFQNSGTKIDLLRTCFKDGKWTVASKYITSFCQRKKRPMKTTETVDKQCKGGHMETRKFHFQRPGHHTESSGD